MIDMRFTAYILLMLSFSIVFSFIGYQAPLLTLLNGQGNDFLSGDMIKILLIGAFGVAGIAVSMLTGFGAIYIIPCLFLGVLLNYLVFPTSLLINTAIFPSPDYDMIRLPLLAIFNVLTTLAIVNFVRGQT